MKMIVIYNIPKNGIEFLTRRYNISNHELFLKYFEYLAYFRLHDDIYDGWSTYDKYFELEDIKDFIANKIGFAGYEYITFTEWLKEKGFDMEYEAIKMGLL